MAAPRSTTSTRYLVDLQPVREVQLVGTADLAFWQAQLQPANLTPVAAHGRALLVLGATALHWLGCRFQECVLSVAVGERRGDGQPSAVYLAHAFSSARLFAFSERAVFHTPYTHAAVQVSIEDPVGFSVSTADAWVLQAVMAGGRPPLRREDQRWEGPIYLPPGPSRRGRHFVARLGGTTVCYPFVPACDTFALNLAAPDQVSGWLRDSQFRGMEWRVRSDARHARSKTYTHRG